MPQTPAMYCAMLGIADVAPAGKLIALLPVLAAALAVGLTDDRAVAALRLADAAGGEHEIDRAERVLDAVASGARCRARGRGSCVFAVPHHSAACRIARSGDAGDLGGSRGVHCAAVLRDCLEPDGVLRR